MKNVTYIILGSIFLNSIGWSGPARSATIEYCPPYGTLEQPAVDLGKGFMPFRLQVLDLPDGRKNVRVTGETVRVDRANLGALIKAAGRYDPRISDFTIDARVIEMDGALSFDNAKVTLVADEVRFARAGTISLLLKPQSALTIIANIVRLPEGNYGHFDLRPIEVSGGLPSLPSTGALFSVIGRHLYIGQEEIDESAAAARLARRFTLGRLYDFQPLISVQLGTGGEEEWTRRTVTEAGWPTYSTAVWAAAFRLSPFDEGLKATLKEKFARYDPLFERLSPDGQVIYRLSALNAALVRGTDLDGNGAAWATSLPLSKLLERIESYSTDEGLGRRVLNEMIALLRSARDGTRINTVELQRATEAEIRTNILAFEAANIRLGEIETAFDSENRQIEGLKAAYKEREQRLKEHAEDLERSAQARSQIVSGLATAASVAATAYTGNPQTGAIAGGIVYAVGNAQSGRPVIDSLSAGVQFASAIQGPLSESSKAAAALKEGRSQYADFIKSFTISNITIAEYVDLPIPNPKPGEPTTRRVKRDEALKDMGKRGEALGKSLQGVLDVYNKFVPQRPEIPPALEDDATLKQHAGDMQKILERVKALLLELDTLQRSAQGQQDAIVAASERLAKLRAIDPANEEARRATANFAFEAAREELATFAVAMLDLRRLSLLEFSEPLPLDIGQLQRVLVHEETSPQWDPARDLDQRAVLSSYIALLEERRNAIQILAVRAQQSSRAQFESYVARRGTRPIVSYPEQQFTDSARSPADERRFIRELNDTLAMQYKLLSRGPLSTDKLTELRRLQTRRIEVPFNVEHMMRARYPVRLIKAAVIEVRRNGTMNGGDLSLTLEVERVGNYRRPSEQASNSSAKKDIGLACFSVDLRSKDSSQAQYYLPADFTIGDIDAHQTLPRASEVSFWYLSNRDAPPNEGRTMFISYPPAEARMYLQVRMDETAAWISVPAVTGVTVKAEVFE